MSAAAMVRPRWIARLAAWILGYFWLPCPSCGRDFAGFECGRRGMRTADGSCRVCCRACDGRRDLDKEQS
jgi:hypothetical protein